MRFILAVFVVGTHLGGYGLGALAVYGFYLISGFLMALVLNETYKFRLMEFAFNRFLRLFPIYYLILLGSLLIFSIYPDYSSFHPAWKLKSVAFKDVLGNFLIFPFEMYPRNLDMAPVSLRVVPTSWSIAVELVCYFILWLIVARGIVQSMLVFALAALYHVAVYDMSWGYRYYPFWAAMLPFSMGSLGYFIYKKFPERYALLLLVGSMALWLYGLNTVSAMSFYINIVALFFFMISATLIEPHWPKVKKLGKAMGDLAYPIFLSHWIVAFTIYKLFLGKQHLFIYSLVPTIIVSYVLVKLSDQLIEPHRNKIRLGLVRG